MTDAVRERPSTTVGLHLIARQFEYPGAFEQWVILTLSREPNAGTNQRSVWESLGESRW